jgi:all-trans-retinol dehydrogenase (NAD+)
MMAIAEPRISAGVYRTPLRAFKARGRTLTALYGGSMGDLRDKTVLITGAASGLGRLLAHKMAARGARLVLWDVDAQGLERVRAELVAAGRTAAAYPCNLRDRTAIATVAAATLREHGPVDVLVNNAGVVSGKTLLDASDDHVLRTFEVNTLALFWTTRAFLPEMMRRNSGHIVTIASAAGIVGTSRLVDYCSSKHAAVGFDESLRLELRRLGSRIRTTVVCPFYITTGMFTGVKTRFQWLLPILDPEYATDRIMQAIERDRRRLIMPRVVYATFLGRILPVNVFDGIMEFLGINKSMDDFVGRATH